MSMPVPSQLSTRGQQLLDDAQARWLLPADGVSMAAAGDTNTRAVAPAATAVSPQEATREQGGRPRGDGGDSGDTPVRRTSWSAPELMGLSFPAPRWAVPGIVAEGLTVLAGPPKVGKSWLGLCLAVAVASGRRALGKIDVTCGDVLYLALEDTPRRLQTRLAKVLGHHPPPTGLTVSVECEPLPAGGTERIKEWLHGHPAARLVIIDVFARVRGTADPRTSAYEADYAAVQRAKTLADEHGVAVLLVHHVRKAPSEDFLSEVSGTHGLAGAADAVMVLQRSRGEADAALHVTGRDVDEQTHALQFDAEHGVWSLLDGPAVDHLVGETRAAILGYLREHPELGPKAIAEGTSLSYELVKQTCGRMVSAGQLERGKGRGTYTSVTAVTAVTSAGQDLAEVSPRVSQTPKLSPPQAVCRRCKHSTDSPLVDGRCGSCAYLTCDEPIPREKTDHDAE
jgi:hypothetical protein